MKDDYLSTLRSYVSLSGKTILEVGCGNGSRTLQIAECCDRVFAIDPDMSKIEEAMRERSALNIEYRVASADVLPLGSGEVDVVFFTLSFHHIPIDRMKAAIDEALRVLKTSGVVVFFEPAFVGSFFEAEMLFDACDGDERKEKAAAYAAMLSHKGLQEIAELDDETIFSFDSMNDFLTSMNPGVTTSALQLFLEEHHFLLKAQRRINIFRARGMIAV